MTDKERKRSGQLEPVTIRATFLYMWRELDRNGFIFEAKAQPEIFREAGKIPTPHTFVCWGLVCRFWRPGADPIAVWEQEARLYFEAQLQVEKKPSLWEVGYTPTSQEDD